MGGRVYLLAVHMEAGRRVRHYLGPEGEYVLGRVGHEFLGDAWLELTGTGPGPGHEPRSLIGAQAAHLLHRPLAGAVGDGSPPGVDVHPVAEGPPQPLRADPGARAVLIRSEDRAEALGQGDPALRTPLFGLSGGGQLLSHEDGFGVKRYLKKKGSYSGEGFPKCVEKWNYDEVVKLARGALAWSTLSARGGRAAG